MGLLTKEVEIQLTSKNIKHYEKNGYEIPRYYNKNSCTWRVKRGTTIFVKIEDVPKFSHINVYLECDCCGKHYPSLYSNYSKQNHNGKTYCTNCSKTILNCGENSACWKDTITIEEREIGRNYLEYTNFIKRVLARDNYTCQCCGKRDKKMEVHHLDGYDWCIERRTDDTNGLCLCPICHKSFHMTHGYGGNSKEQFEKWIGCTIGLLKKYNGELPTTRKVYCLEDDCIYDSVDKVSEINNISASQIRKCCNKDGYKDNKLHNSKSVNGKHYFWLDEYKNMTQENIEEYLQWANSVEYNYPTGKEHHNSKSVICTTTGKIFDTMTEGAKFYDICGASLISRCCRGATKTCGQLSDGMKLQWKYYKDYLESTASSKVNT